jgi:hypothetical protein
MGKEHIKTKEAADIPWLVRNVFDIMYPTSAMKATGGRTPWARIGSVTVTGDPMTQATYVQHLVLDVGVGRENRKINYWAMVRTLDGGIVDAHFKFDGDPNAYSYDLTNAKKNNYYPGTQARLYDEDWKRGLREVQSA